MENPTIPSSLNNPPADRNINDSVFLDLFSQKKYLFQLYQALHPEDKKAAIDDLKYLTMENVPAGDIYNYLSVLIGDRLLILVEAQSTWTDNIIIRCMMYMAKTYEDYLTESSQSLFSEKMVKLPKPEPYVIYTGDSRVESEAVSLSEEFFGGRKTSIDVRVKVITDGKDGDIINQYVLFAKIVNDQIRLYGRTRAAIIEAIRICMDRNILKEYLSSREKAVIDIMVTLFDQREVLEDYIASVKRETAEETEKATQLEDSKKTACAMYKKEISPDIIAECLNTNPETVEEWLGLVPQT